MGGSVSKSARIPTWALSHSLQVPGTPPLPYSPVPSSACLRGGGCDRSEQRGPQHVLCPSDASSHAKAASLAALSEGSALGVRHGECEPQCAATSLVGSTLAAPWPRESSPVSSASSRPAPRADPFPPSSAKPSCSAWLSTSTGCYPPVLHRGCQQSQITSR